MSYTIPDDMSASELIVGLEYAVVAVIVIVAIAILYRRLVKPRIADWDSGIKLVGAYVVRIAVILAIIYLLYVMVDGLYFSFTYGGSISDLF